MSNSEQDGNPPTLTRIADGQLCLTYGYRDTPFKMRAKLSDNNDATCSDHIVLSTDGDCPNLGYPRTIQAAFSMIVTCYYWNTSPEDDHHIAATLWKP